MLIDDLHCKALLGGFVPDLFDSGILTFANVLQHFIIINLPFFAPTLGNTADSGNSVLAQQVTFVGAMASAGEITSITVALNFFFRGSFPLLLLVTIRRE